jgi:type IV pilus assembly protein PilN
VTLVPRINLLPYREKKRLEEARRFQRILVGVAVVAVGLAFLLRLEVAGMVSSQNARNRYLRRQTGLLVQKIGAVNHLRQERERLVNRIRVIERLQADRPLMVHLMNQLVKTLPSGVFIEKVDETPAGVVVIHGVAQSPARVSTYMRRIARSTWFGRPRLSIVATYGASGLRRSRFVVSTKLINKAFLQKTSRNGGHGPGGREP